jgi:3',5'-cyclic AMP phosphodiesterase CpdA
MPAMSQLSDTALSRRRFLKLILASTGALTAIQLVPASADGSAQALHWAFLSDIHIKAADDHAKTPKGHHYYNPHAHLKRGVGEVLAAKPDGMIVTGDLARLTGGLDDYQKLAGFLAPLAGKVPAFYGMGNHDDRDHFATVFPNQRPRKQPVAHKYVVVVEQGPVRFIILDSMVTVNHASGLLGPEQLDWLRGFLAKASAKPTLICLHHVPDEAGKSFQDSPRLLEIIRPARQVKAVIYGHSHVYHYGELDGIHLVNLPALGYTFKAEQAAGWVDAKLTAEGGEFTFQAVEGPKTEHGKTHSLQWRA